MTLLKRWVGCTLLCRLPVLWGASVSDEAGGCAGVRSIEMAQKAFSSNLIIFCMTYPVQ